MIKIVLRNKEREARLADLLRSELVAKGSIFVSFPIKGKTRKMRGGKLYRMVNADV